VVNASKRVEVPKKTTQAPSVMKKGRATTTKKDNSSSKRQRKEKGRPLQKIVNVSQPKVDKHLVDVNIPRSRTQVCYINENASRSENPSDLVLGNDETSNEIQEISINYTSSGEVYNHSTTIVNPCFSTIIAEKVLVVPDPKTMIECKRCSDMNKWKEAIEAELSSLKKRKVFI
jgi:hypothetical protein